MATLVPQLTLSSTDLFTDTTSFSVADNLSVAGDVKIKQLKVTGTSAGASQTLLAHASYNRGFLYLKNMATSAGNHLTVYTDAATNDIGFIRMDAGEFGFFPWTADDANLEIWAATNHTTVEYAFFELTA